MAQMIYEVYCLKCEKNQYFHHVYNATFNHCPLCGINEVNVRNYEVFMANPKKYKMEDENE